MKKIIVLMMMMLVASGVNAQSSKHRAVQKNNMYAIKQAALNAFKRNLIAPSQFILTDYNGNRIGVNGIEAPTHIKGSESKEWSDSAYFYNGSKWSFRNKYDDEEPDSIWVYKIVQKPSSSYYVVTIIGDARNRAGGYEQIIRRVYVYGEAPYFYGRLDPFSTDKERYHVKTIVCEKKPKKEKTVEEMSYEDTLTKEINELRNELSTGIHIINGKKVVVTKSTSDKKGKVSKSKLNRRSNDDVYVMY